MQNIMSTTCMSQLFVHLEQQKRMPAPIMQVHRSRRNKKVWIFVRARACVHARVRVKVDQRIES